MRYLVGIDTTKESLIAFDVALRNATTSDYIILTSIVEPQRDDSLDSRYDQQFMELQTINKLSTFGEKCLSKKIPYSVLVMADNHAGKALCQIAEEQNIDCILVGRRDISPLKRMLIASTSKYCIEHSVCNVLVVKREYPAEIKTIPLPAVKATQQMASEFTPISTTLSTSTQTRKAAPRTVVADEGSQTDYVPPTIIEVPVFVEVPVEVTKRIPSPAVKEDKIVMKRSDVEVYEPIHHADEVELAHKLEQDEWRQYVDEKHIKEQRVKEHRKQRLQLVHDLEEKERARRVGIWEKIHNEEVERRKVDSNNNLELSRIMEDKERLQRLTEIENDKLEQLNERLRLKELVLKLEEEERALRTQLTEAEEWACSEQRKREDLERVKEMEEEERQLRMAVTLESRMIDLENSKDETARRRRRVIVDEEIERQRRVMRFNDMIELETAQQAEASLLGLERVKIQEEQERQYRIKRDREELIRETLKEKVQSWRDLQLAKEMEEEERVRRVELAPGNIIVRSIADLELVKRLEEEERQRRIQEDDLVEDEQEHQAEVVEREHSLDIVKSLEEAERHRRMRLELGAASV